MILVSANKLTRYIEPCQLTDDFGGTLEYDHSDWLSKRLVGWKKKEVARVVLTLVATATRRQVCKQRSMRFAGLREVHQGVDVPAGRAVHHQRQRQEQLHGQGQVRAHTRTRMHSL